MDPIWEIPGVALPDIPVAPASAPQLQGWESAMISAGPSLEGGNLGYSLGVPVGATGSQPMHIGSASIPFAYQPMSPAATMLLQSWQFRLAAGKPWVASLPPMWGTGAAQGSIPVGASTVSIAGISHHGGLATPLLHPTGPVLGIPPAASADTSIG